MFNVIRVLVSVAAQSNNEDKFCFIILFIHCPVKVNTWYKTMPFGNMYNKFRERTHVQLCIIYKCIVPSSTPLKYIIMYKPSTKNKQNVGIWSCFCYAVANTMGFHFQNLIYKSIFFLQIWHKNFGCMLPNSMYLPIFFLLI